MIRIPIGVSSCLLGERVRYDGDHKRDQFIAGALARYVEYIPCCPEMVAGLGVPRATIRLRATASGPRAIQAGQRDVTVPIAAAAAGMAKRPLAGYILKSRSPSCGLRVRVHGGRRPGHAPGIFAAALRRRLPFLPLEEESRLQDPARRDSFLARVFICHRWQSGGVDPEGLADFHARYGGLTFGWSVRALQEMDVLAARSRNPGEYLRRFLTALSRPPHRDRLEAVLKSAARGKPQLSRAAAAWQSGRAPLIAALAALD